MNIDLSTKTTEEVKAYGYELQKIIFAGLNAQQQLAIIEQELQRRTQMPKTTSETTGTEEVVQTSPDQTMDLQARVEE